MSIKQEVETSPAQAVLADRLAKYAYTSPSPSRRATSRGIRIKAESSPSTGHTRPIPSPARSANDSVKPESEPEALDCSPSLQAHSRPQEAVADPSATDDDLESLTEEVECTPRRSTRTSTRRIVRMPFDAVSQGSSSEDEAYQASEASLEEEPDGRTRTQKRIKTRRAMGQERYLLSSPDRRDEVGSNSQNGRRKRRRVDRVEDGEEGRVERNSPRRPRAYADPEIYGHLRPLPDIMAPNLDVVFCGINPGMRSSKLGHHFAHPTNKFWRSLHYSGLTSRLVPTTEDHLLPTEYNYGLTVLVDRPTAEQSELSTREMRLNALPFTEKLKRYKPLIVCFVGKKIWDVYEIVIAKNASPAILPSNNEARIKLEPGTEATTPIKIEPGSEDANTDRHATTTAESNTPPRRETKVKVKFDWTQPRSFRLPHPEANGRTRYTYFWVVPNTSGLERTPLAEQIVLFGHLNKFKAEIKAGRTRGMGYREFDVEGVRQTVDKLQRVAGDRDPAANQRVKLSPA